MNPTLYEERTFSWKIKMSQIIPGHNINEKMILNFDQIPVGFTSPNLTTCTDKISGYMSVNEKLDRFVNELFDIELY